MKATQAQKEEHERFKNMLVEEVLGDKAEDRVPMEKVVMLLWQFRDDPAVVGFMARFMAKYSGMRHVLDGIEFYLPQIAHMIIHLEVDWDDDILERFALIVAQQSLHFALQLNWILQGALQDYEPELDDGTPNHNYNRLFYIRCLKLLKNIERTVVYGKPRAQALQRLYEQGKITKKELQIMEHADRRFVAMDLTTAENEEDNKREVELDGVLFIRMPTSFSKPMSSSQHFITTSNGDNKTEMAPSTQPAGKDAINTSSGEFVQRFCVLDRSVLNVYIPKGACASEKLVLDRAMSLLKGKVESDGEMSIKVETPKYQFFIRCSTKEEHRLWLRRLQEESYQSLLFQKKDKNNEKLRDDLTAAQLNRYDFFENERNFINSLTELAEELRFKDRSERKQLAPILAANLVIPETVYLPLCNSSDIWRRVAYVLPKETRVFNTKARCPTIINFVSLRGETLKRSSGRIDPNLDIAEYMHLHFEVTTEMEEVVEGEEGEEQEFVGIGGENGTIRGGFSDNLKNSEHDGSGAWAQDDIDDEPMTPKDNVNYGKGNTKVQRLLRESVVTLPIKLATRLPSRTNLRRVVSVMDRQTKMQPMIPIVENNPMSLVGGLGPSAVDSDNASVGDGSVVSIGRSSVLVKDRILYGALEEGDIDIESIDRAKKFISNGESWADKSARMLVEAQKEIIGEELSESIGQLEIAACMSKSNDDLRQEVFVMQMIHYYKSVFAQAKLPLWLKTYRILSTGSSTGLIEVLTDATSLDGLKKSDGFPYESGGLRKYFEMVYGGPNSKAFIAAQTNFMQSLAAYGLVSYLLGLKDRHNGNIMIDTRGHLIFIDFGFAMGMAPGHEFSMERAPFKLTNEFVELMGGVNDECYKEFERLFVQGFIECRKNSQIALGLVEIMMYKSNYPCFSGWRYGNGKALVRFEQRLMLRIPDSQIERRALALLRRARGHIGTYLYDVFQNKTNGYAI